MKPQAAGHTRARPPWAPGSGRDGGVWPHPLPGSEAGEQPCGKSARPSSSPVTPRPPASGCFLRAPGKHKQDGQTLPAARGRGMRAGAMSVLGDEHSPDLKGVLSPTKMTSDGFSCPKSRRAGAGEGSTGALVSGAEGSIES